MKKHIVTAVILTVLSLVSGYGQYTVESVPSPKAGGQDYFVSNPDGILNAVAEDSINSIAVAIERKTTAEVAVVVIDDFVGQDDFQFAFELFESWKIGKKEKDNGLLLLVARERRNYRFITGYGMEAVLPDAILKRIGEVYMVPSFKAGNYGEGVLKAMNVIRDITLSPGKADEIRAALKGPTFLDRYGQKLLYAAIIIAVIFLVMKYMDRIISGSVKRGTKVRKGVKEFMNALGGGCGCFFFLVFAAIFGLGFSGYHPAVLFRPALIPWYAVVFGSIIVFFKYQRGNELVSKSFRDEKNKLEALGRYHRSMALPLLLSPLAFFMVLRFRGKRKKMKERFLPPDNSGAWSRMDRDKLKKSTDLLSGGQLKEEWALSRSYEIWKHRDTGEVRAVSWPGPRFRKYADCQSCGFRTLGQETVKTITSATYDREGRGKRIRKCVNCNHVEDLGIKILPRKQRSSSSSGGGFGGSSSSSSGGSFGGGSSGGGGAGGSW
ncbi:TPM domain-containing protein [Sinomicrobium soli]|uniref:TPM domain-containing protein n=1 Tax=Sinomicrobium sp. N-1-3-6 TaxID=2219864 RepID=UPI0013749D06|nr:TPM domain-containing protein [Sinomicrobium sp. N-1-3-6]